MESSFLCAAIPPCAHVFHSYVQTLIPRSPSLAFWNMRSTSLRESLQTPSQFRLTTYRSFKYVHGSKTLDTRRAPAYIDRILWSFPSIPTSPPPSVTCKEYTSHEILWSDHRPVSASFRVEARVADEGNRSIELAGVRKDLDKLEEIYRPSLVIEGTSLEFGDVRYVQLCSLQELHAC